MSSVVLDLWDQALPPGKVQVSGPEILTDQTGDDQRLNRVYSNVSQPTITLHQVSEERVTGAAVVVFPGGGYHDVWIDKEGHDIARWLNLFGVTAIVVKYRTSPAEVQDAMRNKGVQLNALQDAQRAMRVARTHAAEWGIDPDRIGAIGFSAGGHLILSLLLKQNEGDPQAADPVERCSSQVNFSILIYPAVPQNLVDLSPDLGPVFIVNGGHDVLTRPEGALRLSQALVKAGVPVELHLFRQGEHGFGLGITGGSVRCWMDLCEQWMRELGYLVTR